MSLLRDQPDEGKESSEEQLSAPGRAKYRPSEAVQWMGYGLVGIIVLFGIEVPSPCGASEEKFRL